MFERYTEKARRTIFFARHEASQFGSSYIETEHLLLGLLNDGFLGARVLEGLSVQAVREDILAHLPRQRETLTSVDLPLSDDAKRVLAYGADEAERLADRQIRNQHILLGLMRVEECYSVQLLKQKGLVLETLRSRIAGLTAEEEAVGVQNKHRNSQRKSPGIPAGYAWPPAPLQPRERSAHR